MFNNNAAKGHIASGADFEQAAKLALKYQKEQFSNEQKQKQDEALERQKTREEAEKALRELYGFARASGVSHLRAKRRIEKIVKALR